jgi:hypothetical protein
MHSGKMQYPCLKERSVEKNSSFLENKAMGYILVLGFVETKDPTAIITGLTYQEPSFIYFGLGITSGFSVVEV